jgi:hypothetical protein
VFDYMFSSDVFVDDMAREARLLVEHLRLHPPSPKAIVTDSPEAHATMIRLHKSFAEAPTRLEIIQPAGTTGHWNVAHIQDAWRSQRERPIRFHNNVLVGDVDMYAETLKRRGVPYVIDATLRFRRMFVGIHPERIDTYDPTYDAGLRFEILPFSDFPVEAPADDSPPADAGPRIVRVHSRTFLVSNLDHAVERIARTFGWEPTGALAHVRSDNVRRAWYDVKHARSAGLELIEPSDDSDAGRFIARYGAGAYTTTFSVDGLAQWPELLAASGLGSRRMRDHDLYGPRVAIEPGPIGPIRFELVESRP